MPRSALDEDGNLHAIRALHREGNSCRYRWAVQARAGALAAFTAVLGGVVFGAGIMIAARRGLVHQHRRRLGHVRHGMSDLPEDELAHQQENHGPTMEME